MGVAPGPAGAVAGAATPCRPSVFPSQRWDWLRFGSANPGLLHQQRGPFGSRTCLVRSAGSLGEPTSPEARSPAPPGSPTPTIHRQLPLTPLVRGCRPSSLSGRLCGPLAGPLPRPSSGSPRWVCGASVPHRCRGEPPATYPCTAGRFGPPPASFLPALPPSSSTEHDRAPPTQHRRAARAIDAACASLPLSV